MISKWSTACQSRMFENSKVNISSWSTGILTGVFSRALADKPSTDAYHMEYENSREKLQDYVRYFERLLQERKATKHNCEQAEIFYDAQYQDANIVVEVSRAVSFSSKASCSRWKAYKNFGDKVATLKRKLDSLVRDLPETVSSPSGDNVPSPGKRRFSDRWRESNLNLLPGNTPPDYRQTDMDLSDNEENNCEQIDTVQTDKSMSMLMFILAKSPSDRTASKIVFHFWMLFNCFLCLN